MIRFILIFTVVGSMLSCKKDATPDINMSDDAIVALIQDMHIANAAIRKYKKEHRDSVGQIFRNEMSKIHNIEEEQIDFVMEQIQRSPKKYLELEKLAVTNLKALKDSLKTSPVIKKESTKEKEEKRPKKR